MTKMERLIIKSRYRTPVQLGCNPELFKQMHEAASANGLPLSGWLRFLAIKEMRRMGVFRRRATSAK